MKLLNLFALGIIASVGTLNAQNFEYADFELTQQTFSGSNLTIKKDDGTGAYSGPQYIPASETSFPVAYPSGSSPTVQANFKFACDAAPDSIYVRGAGSNDITFASTKVEVLGSSGNFLFNYPPTNGSAVFTSGKVDYYSPYIVKWEISFDNVNWRLIDSSSNVMYVTRNTPMSETSNYKWFESVYDISCRNAVGNNTEPTIIAGIWNEFTDQQVLNSKGDTLHYYKIMNTSNTTLPSLLKYRDAQCYTFAQLFLACIKIQGIIRTNNYINITPNNAYVCGSNVNRFLVKNWEFGTATASSTCASFPYRNTYTTLIPPPYTAYEFTYADVTDQTGTPGPGNPNPSSYFNNHQISLIDGVYYDACYGVSYPTLAAYTTACIEGWSYRITSGSTSNCYFSNNLSLSAFVTSTSTF